MTASLTGYTEELYNKEYLRKYRKKHFVKRMLSSAKSRTQKLGQEFTLEEKDIKVNTHCPYLGIELVVSDNVRSNESPSLDRIDNKKGYIKGNVEMISNLANTMKGCATKEQLMMFAKEILKRYEHNS